MSILPEDDGPPVCGAKIPFLPRWLTTLPEDHPFTRACILHDYEFGLSHEGKAEKTKDEADIDLFYRFALLAKAASTSEEKVKLLMDICKYWPLGREVGRLFWEGDPKKE